MMDFGEAARRRGGDEALRQHDGGVGLPRPEADPDPRGPGRAARDPLGAPAAPQLRLHQHRAHLEDLAHRAAARRHVRRAARSPTSATRRRRRCRSTSASRPTTAGSSSTPSWTARCHVFDVSDPAHPKQVVTEQIGKQANMVSETWDGERVYFTSSLLANWDKKGDGRRAVPEGVSLGRQASGAALRRRLPEARSSAARTSCTSGRTRSIANQIYSAADARLARARTTP